jgi:cytochrome P450
MDPLIGTSNIVTSDGPRWKHLHKMLSPAFSVQHISSMRPAVSILFTILILLVGTYISIHD